MQHTNWSVSVAAVLLLTQVQFAIGQCQPKSGLALPAHPVASATGSTGNAGMSPALPDSSASAALSTGLADTIRLETLPGGMTPDPKAFRPLLKLSRPADGSFILKAGLFEADVQVFSLDEKACGSDRGAGFLPAPIKGARAAVIAAILKSSERHPDVAHSDIQTLLWLTVSGTELAKMPPAVQQTAAKLLPRDVLASLQSPVQAVARNAGTGNQDTKISNNASLSAANGTADEETMPLERGTWAEMPGGFFVRYLPDGCTKIRLQVLVPDVAVSPDKRLRGFYNPSHYLVYTIEPGPESAVAGSLTFDPTQFLAVSTQAPALRLGVTLRPAK